MTETIIVALISLFGSFVGAFSGLRLTSYRIKKLEESDKIHCDTDRKIPVLEEKIKVLNYRVADLEG